MATRTKPEMDDNLVAKLAWIIGDLPQLKKMGYNAGQNFRFISVEQMKKEIIPRCADLGIIMYPVVQERLVNHRDRIKDGEIIGMSTEIQLTTTWNVTDGEESLDPPLVTVGESIDVQDKAANKASTGAQKNLFKTLFGVTEEGEDNDANTPVRQDETTRPAPQRQAPKKRELTDAQKELLRLKDQAVEDVQRLGVIKQVAPEDVIAGLIQEGYLEELYRDLRNVKHRKQAQTLIDAVQKYIDDNELKPDASE